MRLSFLCLAYFVMLFSSGCSASKADELDDLGQMVLKRGRGITIDIQPGQEESNRGK